MRRRSWASAAVAAALLAGASGCGAAGGVQPGEHVTVYVSAPLRGPDGARGRQAVRRAKRVLAGVGSKVGDLRVRAVYMDDAVDGHAWSPVAVAANARRAAEDSTAVAYVGELDSRATDTSQSITEEAGMLQVAPVGAGAMRQALNAIRDAGDAGDDRQSVRDAWHPPGG